MDNGKDEKIHQVFFIFAFVLFYYQINEVNGEKQNSRNAHRSVKNAVIVHCHFYRSLLLKKLL